MSDWREQIETYLSLERNNLFRDAVEELQRQGNSDELRRLFSRARLTFGTAGIRGPMGPGFGQMNDLVIVQTSQGIVSYLLDSYGEGQCRKRGVIIGHDARHNSARFGRLAALAFIQRSIPVFFCDQIVATPQIAFGVTHFNCLCGIMITASHNPKQDNGYKVYWANGAQIQAPHDANIQRHILRKENQTVWSAELSYGHHYLTAPAASEPPPGSANQLPAHLFELVHLIRDELCRGYFAHIQRLVGDQPQLNQSASLEIVYSAMHGVGHQFLTRALHIAGFRRLHPVEAQMEPDPDFPTVRLPNPEEAGALELAFATAASANASLILANDPDADRCAAALYCPVSRRRRLLSGNEIGQLLGWWAWHQSQSRGAGPARQLGRAGARSSSSGASRGRLDSVPSELEPGPDFGSTNDKTPATPITRPRVARSARLAETGRAAVSSSNVAPSVNTRQPARNCYMLSTAVSSRFLQTMARHEGFQFLETLTGFKYMGNATHELLKRGKSVLFAYEEALGYMVDAQILDKDGISAAVQLAQCAAYLAHFHGRTLEAQLNWLYSKYGYHYSLNSYFLCREPRTIRAIFHALQSDYPSSFVAADEEFAITRLRDLNNGIDNGTPNHRPDLPTSADSFMVTFWTDEPQIRFTIRTSGTEPKIKYYSEIVAPLSAPAGNEAAEAEKRAAQARLGRFVAAAIERCLRPAFYKLEAAAPAGAKS